MTMTGDRGDDLHQEDDTTNITCDTNFLELKVPSSKYSHTICYYVWKRNGNVDASGNGNNGIPPRYIYCFHRLAGNGKEFDYLARQIIIRTTTHPVVVVCADVCGRGQSQYLNDPIDYEYKTYVADAMALINHLSPNQPIDFIGTSMGGLIGMSLIITSYYNRQQQQQQQQTAIAQQVVEGNDNDNHFVVLKKNDNINLASIQQQQSDQQLQQTSLPYITIDRLILNDVGSFVTLESLSSIASYVGCMPTFKDIKEATDFFKKIYHQFGDLSTDQWSYLVNRCIVYNKNTEQYQFHFDPAISINLKKVTADVDMWTYWDNIITKNTKKILILRGKLSKILTSDTFNRMLNNNSMADDGNGAIVQGIEYDNIGHAPSLLIEDQVQSIFEFLSS